MYSAPDAYVTASAGQRALVLFHGAGGRWYSRFLKPGFHHCLAAIEWRGYWIVIDPKPGLPDFHITQGSEHALGAFYAAHGMVSIGVARRDVCFMSPLMAVSCVSAVKRLIGLRAPLVLTPWQLFRRLRDDSAGSG